MTKDFVKLTSQLLHNDNHSDNPSGKPTVRFFLKITSPS